MQTTTQTGGRTTVSINISSRRRLAVAPSVPFTWRQISLAKSLCVSSFLGT